VDGGFLCADAIHRNRRDSVLLAFSFPPRDLSRPLRGRLY
jgi:hypothetical protein